jgi:hypothetical protein
MFVLNDGICLESTRHYNPEEQRRTWYVRMVLVWNVC